jgi:hypothetical protein
MSEISEFLTGEVDKQFLKQDLSLLLLKIESEHKSLHISEWACRVLASLTLQAAYSQNLDIQCQVLDLGICEVLISVMSTHAAVSQVVSAYGCQTFRNLAWNLPDFRDFLGEMGACEIILFAISMHFGDSDVSEWGTGAVAFLANQNISNSYRFSEANACEILAQTGNFGLNLRHPRSCSVASNVCYAFSFLSEAGNATKLLESGSCDLVAALMRVHHDNERVICYVAKALCGILKLF